MKYLYVILLALLSGCGLFYPTKHDILLDEISSEMIRQLELCNEHLVKHNEFLSRDSGKATKEWNTAMRHLEAYMALYNVWLNDITRFDQTQKQQQ